MLLIGHTSKAHKMGQNILQMGKSTVTASLLPAVYTAFVIVRVKTTSFYCKKIVLFF